jgi:hypothetical protein
MALLNSAINDVVATTIELRSKDIADNVTAHNAAFRSMQKKGNVETASGGYEIRETISTFENGNGGSYSGYDTLATGAQDGFTAAQFQWAQYAVPVTFSGREMAMNSGAAALIPLVKERVKLAEATMTNLLNRHFYLDGTGNNGKNLTGLGAAVPLANTSGVYGGIDRSVAGNAVWRNKKFQATVDGSGVATSATIMAYWNAFYLQMTRGMDKPSIIIAGPALFAIYQAALQPLQRFMSADSANAGFMELAYNSTPVVFESVASGIATTSAYFLNTDFLKLRPHADRNMVALDDKSSINQDATVKTLAWMGNVTCSGAQFQGIYSNT